MQIHYESSEPLQERIVILLISCEAPKRRVLNTSEGHSTICPRAMCACSNESGNLYSSPMNAMHRVIPLCIQPLLSQPRNHLAISQLKNNIHNAKSHDCTQNQGLYAKEGTPAFLGDKLRHFLYREPSRRLGGGVLLDQPLHDTLITKHELAQALDHAQALQAEILNCALDQIGVVTPEPCAIDDVGFA